SVHATGLKLYVDGRPQEFEVMTDALRGSTASTAQVRICVKEPETKAYAGAIDDLRFYSRVLPADEVAYTGIHYPIQATVAGIGGKLDKADEARTRDYYLQYVAPANVREEYASLRNLKEEAARLD